jgi:hypothetical protein
VGAGDQGSYERLEGLRWGGPPRACPHCGAGGRIYRLRRRGGADAGARRVWKCGACRRQFSVLTGTVLAGTRLPLAVWLAALQDWSAEGRPSAGTISDRHGVTPEAARQLLRRVDAALSAYADADPLAAVLGLEPGESAAIRARTPARIRPRRQVGPTADYGDG